MNLYSDPAQSGFAAPGPSSMTCGGRPTLTSDLRDLLSGLTLSLAQTSLGWWHSTPLRSDSWLFSTLLAFFCMKCSNANVLGAPYPQGEGYKVSLGRWPSSQVWDTAEISRQGCVASSKAPDGASTEITPIVPGCQYNICSRHIGLQISQIHTPKSRCVCVVNSIYSARNYWGLKKEIKQSLRQTRTSDLKYTMRVQGWRCSHSETLNTSFHPSTGPPSP